MCPDRVEKGHRKSRPSRTGFPSVPGLAGRASKTGVETGRYWVGRVVVTVVPAGPGVTVVTVPGWPGVVCVIVVVVLVPGAVEPAGTTTVCVVVGAGATATGRAIGAGLAATGVPGITWPRISPFG